MIRYLWAAPATLLGAVVLTLCARRAQWRVRAGIVEAHGPWLAWALRHVTFMPGGAAAMTLGHIVLGQDAAALAATRAHERVHVRQYELWGPLFLPAYFASSLSALLRGRHFYLDNRFEVEARRAELL